LGEVRRLPQFVQEDGMIKVPMEMESHQSFFIVFRKITSPALSAGSSLHTPNEAEAVNFLSPVKTMSIAGPWKVNFDTAMRGPSATVRFDTLMDWSKCDDSAIRYYSGPAVYRNTVFLSDGAAGRQLYLDLGMVQAMAKVRVNGKYVGGAWTPPYRVNITSAVKKGTNVVLIEVVNTWVNRLIGDSRLPVEKRKTTLNVNPYKPESPLAPSGLLGPVRVLIF
jgi:hypothetical protein